MTKLRYRHFVWLALLAACFAAAQPPSDPFHFVILGDRTGETQPGVYEQAWREAADENPAFVLTVGDTIQGLNDQTAEAEWRQAARIWTPYKRFPLYLTPGNHDVWSEQSAPLFKKYAKHPLHYGFDYGGAHFTILDNSRSDELSAEELDFLEMDLKAHAEQRVKFIISHRPSWLIAVAFRNPQFRLHQLAKTYGVQYVIAGHVHQMMRMNLEGITYLSLASSGGHLRASEKYEDGWFFGHALVDVSGGEVTFQIKELGAPNGQGRATTPKDWGIAGLIDHGLNHGDKASPSPQVISAP